MFPFEDGDDTVDVGASDENNQDTNAAPPSEWDGAWATVDKQPWWASVPESARGHFSKINEERDALTRLLDADDATAELRKTLATKDSELSGLKKSLEEHGGKLTAAEKRAAEAEAKLADVEWDTTYDRLQKQYPDIFEDVYYTNDEKTELDPAKGAFVKFAKLIKQGIKPEEAATMARAFLPAKTPEVVIKEVPPKTRDVKPPASVVAATAGGNNPASTAGMKANESFNDALARLTREAGGD